MHPLIQEQIRSIDAYLEQLQEALADQRAELEKRSAEHEQLQREQWRQRKHQVTISHMAEDLKDTQRAIEVYDAERSATRDALQKTLDALKGLRSSLAGDGS